MYNINEIYIYFRANLIAHHNLPEILRTKKKQNSYIAWEIIQLCGESAVVPVVCFALPSPQSPYNTYTVFMCR